MQFPRKTSAIIFWVTLGNYRLKGTFMYSPITPYTKPVDKGLSFRDPENSRNLYSLRIYLKTSFSMVVMFAWESKTPSKQIFTCSKSTTKILEQGVKHVQK